MEAIDLLKLLQILKRDVHAGRVKPVKRVFQELKKQYGLTLKV